MKRLLKFSAFVLFAALSLTICSCSKDEPKQPEQKQEVKAEPATFASQLEAVINPAFTSVEDVVIFQSSLQSDLSIEASFLEIPVDVLKNVSNVLIAKNGRATKRDIVTEYKAQKDIYDNLTKFKPEIDEDPTAVEGQQLPEPMNVSYHYEIDTIDGKPVRVLIKEERYEAK